MAIQQLVTGAYRNLELVLVRMHFSREMDEIGRLSLRKLLMLPWLVLRIAAARLRTGATVLYYPPSSLERIGLYRDVVVLLATRWMFRRTVYHFFSGGITEHYPGLSRPVRWLVRAAMFGPDLAIQASEYAPPDAKTVRARREVVLPNAVEDVPAGLAAHPPPKADPPTILFAAVLRESKGIVDLLTACARIHARAPSLRFRLEVLGRFPSSEMEKRLRALVARQQMEDVVDFTGVVTGEDLHTRYARASIFAFPSYFESEAAPLVVVHALQHALPVVATRWRGIPSLVTENENGYLVEPRDVDNLAARLEQLLADPLLRARLGQRGRERYAAHFTLQAFREGMEAALTEPG